MSTTVDNGTDSALTVSERTRIIAEVRLREEIARAIADEREPKPSAGISRVTATLNSPFFITIIGGVVLAIIGAAFQHFYTKLDNDRAYVRTVRDKKYELLHNFAADLDSHIRFDAWLNNEQRRIDDMRKGVSEHRVSQEDYSQHLRGFQDVNLAYLRIPQASSYAAEIKSLFRTNHVPERLDTFLQKLGTAVKMEGDRVNSLSSSTDITSEYYGNVTDAVKMERQNLLDAMQNDILATNADGS